METIFNFTGIETSFTPWLSIIGGGFIGLSAVLLMMGIGRIMGISGITNGIFTSANTQDRSWRLAVIFGIMLSPWLYFLFSGKMVNIDINFTTPQLIIGGLIVGIGATLGGGCTSGHGICGNARFSSRSIVSTLIFMSVALITVYVTRHVIGG